MTRIKYVAFVATVAALAFSCSKEINAPQEQIQGNTVISACVELNDTTKTAYSQTGIFSWSEGDQIDVWTSSNHFVTFTLKSGAGSSSASFTANLASGETITNLAVYPAGKYTYESDVLKVNMPSAYGSIAAAASSVPMVANGAEAGALKFKMIGAMLQFSYKHIPAGTPSFRFEAKQKISGEFTVDMSGAAPVISASGTETDAVTIAYGAGDDLTSATFTVPVPVGTYNAIRVRMGAADGSADVETSVRSTKLSKALARKSMVSFPEIYIYKTKKYGQKIWFVEYCKEAGKNNNIGVLVDFEKATYPEVKATDAAGHVTSLLSANDQAVTDVWASTRGKNVKKWLNEEGIRYYSYAEMMQGDSRTDGKVPSWSNTPESGTDAMGRAYNFGSEKDSDATYLANGCNAQIKGCCPQGYHVSNLNDWWDLLYDIKSGYGVPDKVYGDLDWVEGGQYALNNNNYKASQLTKQDGYVMTKLTKAVLLSTGATWDNCGSPALWLKGDKTTIMMDEGPWLYQGQNWLDEFNHSTTANPKRQNAFIYKGGNTGFNMYAPSWLNTDGKLWKDYIGKATYIRIPGLMPKADKSGRDRTRSFRIMTNSWRQSGIEITPAGDGESSRNDAIRMPVRCVKNYEFTNSIH